MSPMGPAAPNLEETNMLRKPPPLPPPPPPPTPPPPAPTSPPAGGGHGWHGGWHHHGGGWGGPRFFVGGPAYSYGYGGCYVRRLVPTPWGPRWRPGKRFSRFRSTC